MQVTSNVDKIIKLNIWFCYLASYTSKVGKNIQFSSSSPVSYQVTRLPVMYTKYKVLWFCYSEVTKSITSIIGKTIKFSASSPVSYQVTGQPTSNVGKI